MPTNTPNLNLEKPLGNEKYDVNKINANFDKIDSNALNKLTYKGEVELLADLPSTNQKIGDYYIVIEKGVPYLWNGTEFKAQVVIPEVEVSAQSIGALISSADAKAIPDVDDVFGYSDSEDVLNPNILKKLTWGNIRGSLATFFEGIFALVLHGHAIGDVTGLQTSLDAKAPNTSLRPKNWIINGMFDVWQRGTNQTSSGYGSDDRFINEHGGSTKTHSQQAFALGQIEVPNNPKYFSRTVVNSVVGIGNYVAKVHRIEDVTKLAGKTIVVSFWAKADANKNISIEFRQNFGTGGSASISEIGVQKFALTTSWQKFTKLITLPSVVGKTIASDSYLQMTIWFEAGSNFNLRTDSLGQQSGTFDIANVSLVEGSVAVECQNQPYADVLRDCQRYLVPIVQAGVGGQYAGVGYGIVRSGTTASISVQLKQEMRVIPVLIGAGDFKLHANTSISVVAGSGSIIIAASDSITKSMVNITILTSGLTTGYACYLERNANTTGYLLLDAEL